MAFRDHTQPLLVDPCLDSWRRPLGVDAAELQAVTGEIFREALANRPSPETASSRDYAIWQAARWARRVLVMDRADADKEGR
jgi:hypothetical protein